MARTVRARLLAGLAALAGTALAGSLVAGLLPTAAVAAVPSTPGTRLTGADISWPNCPKGMGIPSRRTQGNPLPLSTARFAIVGLTNGPGFSPNPCLAAQAAWVKAHHVWAAAYAVTTYPTTAQVTTHGARGPFPAGDRLGKLRNTGYQQALFNVTNMRAAGLAVPFVWIDVEPYPVRPWPRDVAANRAVIGGAVRAYQDKGYRVGFYSYAYGWKQIVGDWRLTSFPTWVPAGGGPSGYPNAVGKCAAASFSGGPVMMGQWVEGRRDRDVTCPSLVGRAAVSHPLTRYLATTLRQGSSGTAVRALQTALGMPSRYRTGYFGPLTAGRVKALQKARRLPQSGVTTSATWRALGAGSGVGAKASQLPRYFRAY